MTTVDNCAAALVYPKGTSFVRCSSVEINGWGRRQMVVCGEKGTIEVKPLEKPIGFSVSMQEQMTKHNIGRDTKTTYGYDFSISDRYLEQVRDFARIIRGEMENPYPWEYEYMAQRVNLAACGLMEFTKLPKDFVL